MILGKPILGDRWLSSLLFIGMINAVVPTRILASQDEATCPAMANGQSAIRKISPNKIAELLQQPNGLEAAAKLARHFPVNGDTFSIRTFNLDGLINESSLITVGTVNAKKAVLIDDGNNIFTKYTMQVATPLKGSIGAGKGEVVFSLRGGCFVFGDGTTAEITTATSRYLEIGKQYLVFLYQDAPSEFGYAITGGVEGLGEPLSQEGGFELAADLDNSQHHLISERTKGITIADLVGLIKLRH